MLNKFQKEIVSDQLIIFFILLVNQNSYQILIIRGVISSLYKYINQRREVQNTIRAQEKSESIYAAEKYISLTKISAAAANYRRSSEILRTISTQFLFPQQYLVPADSNSVLQQNTKYQLLRSQRQQQQNKKPKRQQPLCSNSCLEKLVADSAAVQLKQHVTAVQNMLPAAASKQLIISSKQQLTRQQQLLELTAKFFQF